MDEHMEEAVALCPFCKREGAHPEEEEDGYWRVLCTCSAQGPLRLTEAEAIAAWNARVLSVPLKETLQDALKDLALDRAARAFHKISPFFGSFPYDTVKEQMLEQVKEIIKAYHG